MKLDKTVIGVDNLIKIKLDKTVIGVDNLIKIRLDKTVISKKFLIHGYHHKNEGSRLDNLWYDIAYK